MLESEVDMIKIIEEDEWMMEVLKAAASINLPDWWICAGFVRSKIWDTLHGFSKRTEVPDVDVIYFDNTTMDELVEKTVEAELRKSTPDVPWSVKN